MKMIMIAAVATLALTVAAQAVGPKRAQNVLAGPSVNGKVVYTR